MTPDQIRQKIDDLQRRSEAVATKKAAFGGQLQAKKDELAALIKEIRAAGLDPKNLLSERDKAQQELEAAIVSFEADLQKTEATLAGYEKK